MTLVEVIDTLQTWIRNADDEYDREEMGRVAGLKEALHEIKKIEPCEDAISRQAVHEIVERVPSKGDALFEIEDLPPVTPQPKTDILDKIKAEIDQKQYDFMSDGDYNEGVRFGLMLAYQIIDKCKAESEEERRENEV